MHDAPTCWNCGHDISGVRVDGRCPACGVSIWSSRRRASTKGESVEALVWSILALSMAIGCLGPIAIFIAVPAVVKSHGLLDEIAIGNVPETNATNVRRALTMGWIAVVISLVTIVFYLVVALFGSLV